MIPLDDAQPQAPSSTEIEPIPAAQARLILEEAIRARLGERWNDELDGWTVISRHDYMARLVKGSTSVDFYVDLLGDVSIEEKPIDPAREGGRVIAWLVLLVSLAVALTLARAAGVI